MAVRTIGAKGLRGVGRRGIFFTMMSLLVIIFLLSTEQTTTVQSSTQSADTQAAMTRITVMNNMIQTFAVYAQDSLATAGYYTLQNLSGRVRSQGKFITNISAAVSSCMDNATNQYACLQQNQTINDSLSELVGIARSDFNMNIAYNVNRIWVTEQQPFQVIFWMNISYNITDVNGAFANWTITMDNISAAVDVTGIEDPAFAYAGRAGGGGDFNNMIYASAPRYFNATPRSQWGGTNATDFLTAYKNGLYFFNYKPSDDNRSAPSVLQRYEGKLNQTSACCGIESIVPYKYLNATIISDPHLSNYSFVDYYFFTRYNASSTFDCRDTGEHGTSAITILPPFDSAVRIDNHHVNNNYNLTANATIGCT